MRAETQRNSLKFWIIKFIAAKDSENLSPGSLQFYKEKLENFTQYCGAHIKDDIFQVDADLIRNYLVHLKNRHNPGGVHAFFRAIHAFFTWFENEDEVVDWHNPIQKIKAPKVPEEILDPASEESIKAMLNTCGKSYYGVRDRAIIMLLDNTGLRASELLSLDMDAIDLPLSVLYVERGKGGYPRAVDFDRETKRALNGYFKQRPKVDTDAVFVSRYYDRLGYDGLRGIITRRAKLANITPEMLHAFRRKHVLDMYRAGEGELTIQKRVGHRDGKTIHRYIKLSREDLRKSAQRTSRKKRKK